MAITLQLVNCCAFFNLREDEKWLMKRKVEIRFVIDTLILRILYIFVYFVHFYILELYFIFHCINEI